MINVIINNSESIISAFYGRDDNQVSVLDLIKSHIENKNYEILINNDTMKCDPVPNIIKKLWIETKFGKYEVFENNILNITIENDCDKEINIKANNFDCINYYFVIFNDEWENMIDYYFIYMKYIITSCGHNYIKVKYNTLLENLKKTSNNVVILYKSIYPNKDLKLIKDSSIKIYFLNVEQLSVLVENNDKCPHKVQIQTYLKKTLTFVKDNNIHLLDYSYENKYLWNKLFQINNVIVLEPCLNSNMIIKSSKRDNNIISLFNHIKYRHDFKSNYLENLEVTSFSGHMCSSRRKLLSKTKILLNIHAGGSYKIAELFRIYEAIAHKNIIISQKCYDENLINLKKYIFFVDDHEFKITCLKILNNYDEIYKKLYDDIDINEIFQNIEYSYLAFFSSIIKHS